MKILYTLCIVVIGLTTNLQGQSFFKQMGTTQVNTGATLVVDENRIYTVLRDWANGQWGTALVVTDTLGVHVASLVCDSFRISDIIKTSDGGFLLSMLKNIQLWTDPTYGSLLKTDSAFNFQWQKSAVDTNFGSPSMIVLGKDGNIYGAGDHQLMNLDLNGNVNWSLEYGNFTFVEIIPTADSGIFARGSLDTMYSCFMKIDKSGSVQWLKSFSGFEYLASAATDGDNHYILLSNQRQVPAYLSTILIKLDAAGNIIWSKKYEETLDNIEALNLFVLSDYSLYLGGIINHVDAFFAHLDSSGIPISANRPVTQIWYRNIYENHGYYYFGKNTGSPSFIGFENSIDSMRCGSTPFTLNYYSSSVILSNHTLATAPGGTLVSDTSSLYSIPWTIIDECSTTGIPENNDSGVSIYPNPGKGSFVFTFPDEGKHDLTIVDETGRTVYNCMLEAGQEIRVTLNLQPGFYFYIMQGCGIDIGKKKSGKLIVQ